MMTAVAKSGAAAEALRLARELLSDQMRVLSPDHPYILKPAKTSRSLPRAAGTT